MNFNGKSGISIELITQKIRSENKPKRHKVTEKTTRKSGTLKANDWKKISMGLGVMRSLINDALKMEEIKLKSGSQEEVSKIRKTFVGYTSIMYDCLRRLDRGVKDEIQLRSDIEELLEYSPIMQAARDGVILKQETRIEKVDGRTKEVVYDTSMTPDEVISVLRNYERQLDRYKYDKLNDYLELGLGLAGVVGMMFGKEKSSANKDKNVSIVTLGTVAISGIKLIKAMMKDDERDNAWKLGNKAFRLRDDLLRNEQVSKESEKDAIRNIEDILNEEMKINNRVTNKEFVMDIVTDLVAAMISGAYVNKNVVTKENGKLDGKSLALALASLQSSKRIAGSFITFVQGVQNSKDQKIEIQELAKEAHNIISQMEEKVYPLKGAKESFTSMEIRDLKGRFYPKKNYETGEITYATMIDIPEFSMKRGDVVLLSGESGMGKSTFLRLLERGDINNRNCIKIDDGKRVDNLGNEYIYFRPSMELGNESNILSQITGKDCVSELDDNEMKSLTKVLEELKLDFSLDDLASRKFTEFSTGQQKRLALSKLFYRIDDAASVIIVDEPVGNVEDSLIREQLEMIKEYAERKDVMLLLTTHRVDLVEDLVTKRYNINSDGVLENVPVPRKKYKEADFDR